MRTKNIGLAALVAALVLPSLGCSSVSAFRYGQLTTGGHVAITEPGLSISPADEGFGFKVQVGHVQFGATTTQDSEAKHLALGIHSSTGFDGVEETLITSATRVGAGPVNIEGVFAIGLGRVTLDGLAEINDDVPPGVYFDHWTGMTVAYEPFPDVPATWAGNAFDITRAFSIGPLETDAGFGIGACRPGFFTADDGQLDTGIGPFSIHLGASWGECTQGIGIHGFAGLVSKSCCGDKDCNGQCKVTPTTE